MTFIPTFRDGILNFQISGKGIFMSILSLLATLELGILVHTFFLTSYSKCKIKDHLSALTCPFSVPWQCIFLKLGHQWSSCLSTWCILKRLLIKMHCRPLWEARMVALILKEMQLFFFFCFNVLKWNDFPFYPKHMAKNPKLLIEKPAKRSTRAEMLSRWPF